jgi:dipeptidyl aminopeptidase/acylaminoacyl peptidase
MKALNVWTIPHLYRNAALASDGQRIIGGLSGPPPTRPSLSLYEPDRKGGTTLVRLNPQFDDLTLASPREVQWTTSTGYEVHGVLLAPPNFKPGIAYPL